MYEASINSTKDFITRYLVLLQLFTKYMASSKIYAYYILNAIRHVILLVEAPLKAFITK